VKILATLLFLSALLLLKVVDVNADTGGDAVAGKALATKQCVICHGADGAGSASGPALKGLASERIISQLQAFKSGTRKNMMMEMVAKKLSNKDIADLAAYFSTL
jgi:cytochrome c553